MNCNRILEILDKSIIDMTRDELYEFEEIIQMLNNHCPREFGLTEQWNRSCTEDNCVKCWIESMRERYIDMTKDDLKEGMILKFKNGKTGILIGNGVFEDTTLGFTRICKTDDILSNLDNRVNGYEIVEVYRIIDGQYIFGLLGILRNMPKHNLKLLWRCKSKREIDWSKVPIWTKVQVRDFNNSEWKNAYFLGYDKTFCATRYDRFTFNGACFAQWKQCRIHETVKIKEEWYK